jgi:hypothetical protein
MILATRNKRRTSSPPCPKQSIRKDEKQEAHECWQKMEEVQITHGKVDANRSAESRAAHNRNDLRKTPIELCTSSHEEEQTADRTQPTTKAGSIMGDKGDQCRRDLGDAGDIKPDESQIRGNEDPGHPKDRDREPGENHTNRAHP